MLSLVVFLRQLFSDIDSFCHFCLTIHCDNLKVVNTAGSLDLADADADVFLQLQSELDVISQFLTIKLEHVRGHQELDFDSPREEVLNHWCDGKAKATVSQLTCAHCQQHLQFPAANVSLSSLETIGRAIPKWIREAASRQQFLSYLQDKYE